MAILRNRKNLVTVRLSKEEYEKLKDACEQGGARSMSDFVRDVIANGAADFNTAHRGLLTGDLASIGAKLEELDLALKDLSRRITAVLGNAGEVGGFK
jgi:Arc/MetJ-type ribon-helix-helix transcriptional regulator